VDTLRSMIMMIAIAGVAAPALVSALVIGVYVWVGWMSDHESAWWVRFLANALSTITLAPLLLTVAGQGRWRVRASALRRAPEFAAVLAGLLVVYTLVLESATSSAQLLLLYAPLPFLLWAAVRFESPGLGVALSVTLLLFVGQTFEGPRLAPFPTDNAIVLTVFLVAIAVPLQLLAALVHERRLAEERVTETQQRYRLATVAGEVSVWEGDVATGRLHVDSMLKRALGYADHEIPDTIEAWRAHVPPSDVARMCVAAQAHLDGATTHCEVEHQMLHKDGSVRWFQTRGAVSARYEGKASRMSGTVVDVTERKHAEEELQVARSHLAHASRLALAGELMASITHEIKQPLSAILARVETAELLLETNAPSLPEIQRILAEIRKDDLHASDVMTRLRDLLRRHTMERRPVDLNETISDALAMVHAEARQRDVTVVTQLASGLPPIIGNHVHLQQVVLNLVLNGMDAVAGVEESARRITIGTKAIVNGVQITVADNGWGIDPAIAPRLFESFATTKSHGLGLGLSIARTIVEAHGGTIEATAGAGHGAVFRVALPTTGLDVDGEALRAGPSSNSMR
jgi:PAS domain S-box-containing protein